MFKGGCEQVLDYSVVDPKFLNMMTEGYFPHCRYLKSLKLASDKNQFVHAIGEFQIPNCCYGVGTSHFNAAELPMCFNQLGYTMFAAGVDGKLFSELGMDRAEDFLEAQRERCFIGKIEKMVFKKPIAPSKFEGRLDVIGLSKRAGNCFYKIASYFYDSTGGNALADFLIVITDKPLSPGVH